MSWDSYDRTGYHANFKTRGPLCIKRAKGVCQGCGVKVGETLGNKQEDIMARRYEIRVQIGYNLIALQKEHAKDGHGDFLEFAEREFGYKRNAIYDHIHVAERLGNSSFPGRGKTNWETARELARPSTPDVVIQQVTNSTVDATPQAIKEARQLYLEEQKKFQAAEKAKEEAEQERDKAEEALQMEC